MHVFLYNENMFGPTFLNFLNDVFYIEQYESR